MRGPTAYLQFDGQCAEALSFYAEALGGRVTAMNKYAEAPPDSGAPPAPPHWIMHGRLEWPGGGMLMASDGGMDKYEGIKGVSMSLNCRDLPEARRLFDALAAGGGVRMPLGPTFWSPGFGMLVDRFGVPWMVNVDAELAGA